MFKSIVGGMLLLAVALNASQKQSDDKADDKNTSSEQDYITGFIVPNKAAHRQNVGTTSVDTDGNVSNQASTSGSGGSSAGASSSNLTSTSASGQGGD